MCKIVVVNCKSNSIKVSLITALFLNQFVRWKILVIVFAGWKTNCKFFTPLCAVTCFVALKSSISRFLELYVFLVLILSWRRSLSCRNKSIDLLLISSGNQWTGFYMTGTSVMKYLRPISPSCRNKSSDLDWKSIDYDTNVD